MKEEIQENNEWKGINHFHPNSHMSKHNACLPDRDQRSQVANRVMFYRKLLAHLLEHDHHT